MAVAYKILDSFPKSSKIFETNAVLVAPHMTLENRLPEQ